MDLEREIAILKKQIEDKSKADDAEKARLRVALEEARAEIKADEAYFDRLVKENERLKADKRRLQNGQGPSRGQSSSLELPARSDSPQHSADVSENFGHKDGPSVKPSEAPFRSNAGIEAVDRAATGHSPAAALQPHSRDHSPLRAGASSQGRPPGSAAGPSAQPAQLGALANGGNATQPFMPGRGSGQWNPPSVSGADQLPLHRASDPGLQYNSPVLARGGYPNLRSSSPLGRPEEAGRPHTYGGSAASMQPEAAAGQVLALLGPASGGNTSELMHPNDMHRLGPGLDAQELTGTLTRVLDELEPLRGLLPLLGQLPSALSALDSLPRIQEMASRAAQMSAQNKEELRTVSRMVAVGSDIIDQNRKTVSQLQDRMAKEEAEGQARAAATTRATQRVEATVTALRREQKQSAQSVQAELSGLQAAQMPARLSEMEAEIAALKAQIAAQSRAEQLQQQQQVPAAARHVPAPAPPAGPFPGAAAMAASRPPHVPEPRPPAAPHPSALAAQKVTVSAAAAPAAAAAAPAKQPGSAAASAPARIGSSWPPLLQQHQSPPAASAVQGFHTADQQPPIPFLALMPMPTASSPVLAPLPPPQVTEQRAMATSATHAAEPSQPSALTKPSGAQEPAVAQKQAAALAGSKPGTPILARQGIAEFGVQAKTGVGSPALQAVPPLAQASVAAAGKLPAVSAPAPAMWQANIAAFLEHGNATSMPERQASPSPHADSLHTEHNCTSAAYLPVVGMDTSERGRAGLWHETCGACEAAYGSRDAFLWHLNSKEHREILMSSANTYQAHSMEVKTFRDAFDWTCRLCDRSFSNLKAYSAHCTQSKAHEAKLAAKIKPLKGRKKSRWQPVLVGRVLRDTWLAAHRGASIFAPAQLQPRQDEQHKPSLAVRIDSGPFRTPSAEHPAGGDVGSPHAEAAVSPWLAQPRSREPSVEEGELVPGQPFPAAAAQLPGSAPEELQAQSGSQAGASGDVIMEGPDVAALGDVQSRPQSPAAGQEALAAQQAARQAYALQRQMKEQKRQEQLQRLNRSLGFAVSAPASPPPQPALSPPSLPAHHPPSSAPAAALTPLSEGVPATSLAVTAASTDPPAEANGRGADVSSQVPNLASAQGFGSPQAVHPAASAALPSPAAAAAVLPPAGPRNAGADETPPAVSAPLSVAAVAHPDAAVFEQMRSVPAPASAAMSTGQMSSQLAESEQTAAAQPAAAGEATLGGAASAVAATADVLVGLLASYPATGASDDCISWTAQEFLDGLLSSQAPAGSADSAPSTGTAPVASAQQTAAQQRASGAPSQDAAPPSEAGPAKGELDGRAQRDASPVQVSVVPPVPGVGHTVQREQPGKAQAGEAASAAAPAGMRGGIERHMQDAARPAADIEAPVSSAPAAAAQGQVPASAAEDALPLAQAGMQQPQQEMPFTPLAEAASQQQPAKGAYPPPVQPVPNAAAAENPSAAAPASEPAFAPPAASTVSAGDQPPASALGPAQVKSQADAQAAAQATSGRPTQSALSAASAPPANVAQRGHPARTPAPLPVPSVAAAGRGTDSPLLGQQPPGVAAKLAKAAAEKSAAKLLPQPSDGAASDAAITSVPPQPPPQPPFAARAAPYATDLMSAPYNQCAPYQPGYGGGQYGVPAYGYPYAGYGPSGAQATYSAQWQQQSFAPEDRQPKSISAAAVRTEQMALPSSAAPSAPAAQGAGTLKEPGEGTEPKNTSPPCAPPAKRGGSPGRSSAHKALIKRRPTIVLKLPCSLPTPAEQPSAEPDAPDPPSSQTAAARASVTEPLAQGGNAKPTPDLRERTGPADKKAAATAAAIVDAGREAAAAAGEKMEVDDAATMQSGSQSPKTPLYFRLTDIALGEGTPAASYGLTGAPAPLSTAATVLRGTSAARSGTAAAIAKTGASCPAWAWAVRPAEQQRAPAAMAAPPVSSAGAANAAAAPAQNVKASLTNPAIPALPASRKRPAEPVRGPERANKRTVIRTGCRPPVQQPGKAGAAANIAAPKSPAASLDSASTSSHPSKPAGASDTRVPVASAPTQDAAPPQKAAQVDKTADPGVKSPKASNATQRAPVGQQASREGPRKEPAPAQKGAAAEEETVAKPESKQGGAPSAKREAHAAAQKAGAHLMASASSGASRKEAAPAQGRPREPSGKVDTPAKASLAPAGKSVERATANTSRSASGSKPATAGKDSASALLKSRQRIFNPDPENIPKHRRPSTAERQRARAAEAKEKSDAARGARREPPKQQTSDSSLGTSHSRRPEASSSSDRRPVEMPKHAGNNRPSTNRPAERSEHRSTAKPRTLDPHPPQPASGRDAPGRGSRVRERDRAFGAPTSPSSPVALSVRSPKSAAPATAAKRPREDDGRDQRREQPPAKKPAVAAAGADKPSPAAPKPQAEASKRPSAEAVRKPAPAPAAPATKPPAAAAAKPAPAPVRKPVTASALKPPPSDKPAPASAPMKSTTAGAPGGHPQIPAPKKPVPVPVSVPVAASQAASAAARQQQPPQQKPSPGSKDRRVQLEKGIAEVRSRLRQLEQKGTPVQGRSGGRTSTQAPPDASHSGRVITISSASQPGPQLTVGGAPRTEGGLAWGAPSASAPPLHNRRTGSPHHFHRGPPGPHFCGGPPPELPFRGGPPREERLQQMGPPGLHMPPVPSLPPYPPPFLPPLYAEPHFPERGPHREQPPQQLPPMFDGGPPRGFPGPQQPPWGSNSYLPPEGYPYRPFYEG